MRYFYLATGLLGWALVGTAPVRATQFNPAKDLISLHYDHAPDKDDGHSAAADRTVLETMFGPAWIRNHVIPVSGAYGKNQSRFVSASDKVMDAVWNDRGGWLSAHRDWAGTITRLADRWTATLTGGGAVWVKEGGQSDLTAAVVRKIEEQNPALATKPRIHVVQHSDWNENQTRDTALAFTKAHTDYIRIKDANRYLNVKGGNAAFVAAATHHPVYRAAWNAAFAYYNPQMRLDFSDTGELFRILDLGELSVDQFRQRFLTPQPTTSRP